MADQYVPRTFDELEQVVLDEILVEGHHVDFKAQMGSGGRSNKELAKDMACFAIDGGRLYIGVKERKDEEPPEVPRVHLDGLREKVDQVARSIPEPPLTVRCIELRDENDPASGVLVVEVPPSGEAPHMVDGRYPGRSDTTTYWMSDAEVRDIFDRRQRVAERIEALLDEEIARDPVPPELREFGHLFVVAQPVAGRPEMLYDALGDNGFSPWFNKVPWSHVQRGWAPDTSLVGQRSRRAKGWAAFSHGVTSDRQVDPGGHRPTREADLLDIEVHEDGGIRLFCGRATEARADLNATVIVDPLVPGLVGRSLTLAKAVADTASYYGTWHIGIAATSLRGAVSSGNEASFFSVQVRYSDEEYRRSVSASYAELEEPARLVDRLVSPLLRSISSPLDISDVI